MGEVANAQPVRMTVWRTTSTYMSQSICTADLTITSCRRASATICPATLLRLWAPKRLAPPSRRNVAVVSHGQYVPTLTAARRVNTAANKAAWWPWHLTLKVVSELRVTWATSVSILVFLSLSLLDLGPMYATDRRQTASSLYAPAYYEQGITILRIHMLRTKTDWHYSWWYTTFKHRNVR